MVKAICYRDRSNCRERLALQFIDKNNFDLILTDLNKPDMVSSNCSCHSTAAAKPEGLTN